MVHCDMVAAYILHFGTEEQKHHWLPKMVKGEAIGSLGMTEPHAGSDLKNIRTRAVRDGADYVIDGQKVFISNGQLCDVLVLATKTAGSEGAKGITLFLVDTSLPGFKRGRNLHKMGMKAQDTSELFFENLRVPASTMLGGEGQGFSQERLAQAIRSATVCETVLDYTVDYVAQRKAFGHTIADFQNTQFKLAELKTETSIGRIFTDHCIERFMEGKLDEIDAAMAKLSLTTTHCKVVDECLQLHGGWGYMWEYPIARAYCDARVVKIAGGSVEVMKHIIGRQLVRNARPDSGVTQLPGGKSKPGKAA
jgi:alkylation response protein AidB-like acyl-CoA dehydrogenase